MAFGFACWLSRDLALDDTTSLDWLLTWDAGNAVPKGADALREILTNAKKYARNAPGAGRGQSPAHCARRKGFQFSFEVEV